MSLNQLNHGTKNIELSSIVSKLKEDKSQKQIAEELGCSEANISKRLKVAQNRGLVPQPIRSIINVRDIDKINLTEIIGDEISIPKDGLFELHQFDAKYYLFNQKYVENLIKYFKRCVSYKQGKVWSPKSNQNIYSVPLQMKIVGKITLRYQEDSDFLIIQGIKTHGNSYDQARDRATILSFKIIQRLSNLLQVIFREDNFIVTRSGDFVYDPPKGSKLKDIIESAYEQVGVLRIDTLQIDNSNKNGGHLEIKTDWSDKEKRNEAIQYANNLAAIICNAPELLQIPSTIERMEYKLDIFLKSKIVAKERITTINEKEGFLECLPKEA